MKTRIRRATAMLVAILMTLTCMPLTTLADIVLDNSSSVQLFSVKPDTAVYVTYEFYNGEEQVGTQIVNQTKGETPTLEPATPATEAGQRFKGWYIGEEEYKPGRVTSYGANTTEKVEAKFGPAVYVYFLTVDGKEVYKSVEVTSEDGTVSLPTGYEPANSYVTGWMIQGTETAFTASTVVTESVYVKPVTEPCWWVTFDSLGYGGVDSRYVKVGETTNLNTVSNPSRVGYDFRGWTTVKNDEKTLVSGDYTVNDNVTLYALWVPAYVDYTVVYWGENADDDGYSMLASRLVKANPEDIYSHKTGDIVKHAGIDITLPEGTTDEDYYTYDTREGNRNTTESVVISPYGSSVINVYYQRKVYQLIFAFNVEGTKYDTTYENYENLTDGKLVFEFKWGADITHIWDISPIKDARENGHMFNTNLNDGKTYREVWLLFQKTMPKHTQTVIVAKKLTGYMFTWYHWLEVLENKVENVPAGKDTRIGDDGKLYYKEYSQRLVYDTCALTYEEDYFPYEGFNRRSLEESHDGNKWLLLEGIMVLPFPDDKLPEITKPDTVPPSDDPQPHEDLTLNLYYPRAQYDVEFHNYGEAVKRHTYYYEADISALADYVPECPDSFNSETAEFIGWYTVDPEKVNVSTMEPYSFEGRIMPPNNLALYAYWVEKPLEVRIDVIIEDKKTTFDGIVSAGESIASSSMYELAMDFIEEHNLTLVKWVDANTGDYVDLNEFLYEDAAIRAVFPGDTFKVIYQSGAGSGADVTDPNNYGPGNETEAYAFPSGMTAPAGKQFAYWTDEAGQVYYPGSTVRVIADDVVLTAQYVSPLDLVKVTYHSNFGRDVVYTPSQRLLNNSRIEVMSYGATGLPYREDYTFLHWDTRSDDSGYDFDAGDAARVDASGSNDLYAIWLWTPVYDMQVKLVDERVLYDGEEHVLTMVEVTIEGAPAGSYTVEEFEAEFGFDLTVGGGRGTDAGTYEGELSGPSETEYQGNDYNVTYIDGTLIIDPIPVTIFADDAQKEYGEADPEFTGTVEGLLHPDDLGEITYDRINGTEEAGKYPDVIVPSYTDNPNYVVTVIPGDFTITREPEPEPEPPVPPVIVDAEIHPAISVEKTAISTPEEGDAYGVGENVTYSIVVTNTGDVALENVKVVDPLTNLNEVIGDLAVGESREYTTAYVITEADAKRGFVKNVAAARGQATDPNDPTTPVRVSDTDDETVKTYEEHELVIEYIYADGSEAHPDYKETLKEGESYHVVSPEIEGYVPSKQVVEGVMPDRDVTVTVIYIKLPEKTREYDPGEPTYTITEYKPPFGVGNVNMNIGDCFE